MSEASDDAQLPTQGEVTAPIAGDPSSDADDVEVLAQAPEPAPTPAPRHDSVFPTSRKLAPPPKPKRDSSNPSVPPPAGDATVPVGSLKAPSAPAISFHDASASSREAVAAALTGNESLRAIGEALAKDAGAFSTSETATGSRPGVPRPRSSPAPGAEVATSGAPETQTSQELLPRSPSELPRPRDKVPTVPDEPAASRPGAAKPSSIFAQRIIAVGTRSERAPAMRESAPPPAYVPPPPPLSVAAPVLSPPLVAAPPTPPPPAGAPFVPPPPPDLFAFPPPIVERVAPQPVVAPAAFLPPVAAPVAFPPPIVERVASPPPVASVAFPPPVVERVAPPPVVVPVDLDRTLEAAPELAEKKRPSIPPLPAVIALDIAAVDDDSLPDIPITTDFDEETPTRPSASPAPLPLDSHTAALAVPSIPDEPTPAPPLLAVAPVAAPVEALAPEEAGPDSADRLPVEELSREDSPSFPPEELTPAMPPPAPSGRPEAKPQPPPPPKRAPAAEPPASAPVAAAAPPREEIVSPETEKRKAKQKRPWWEELFSEDFVRANWKVSDEQIKREVTFVEESLGVAPGGVVLDLGCGSGQHAVELASRGYGVVGYDLSLYQLALAADIAQERSQKINFLQGDMREMAFEEMFDGIFCWNTTFGYFEEDKNFSVAERAFRALRPGGMLLVDVINRDFVAAHTPSSVWFEGDSCVCMDDAVIDYFTSRLRVKRSIILDDGRTRECTYSVRLYSFHELGKLLHEVGFRVTEVSGHPATPGVFLGQASPRILMLAQRP
jgi:SAM-dependent methyltransferase